MELNITIRKTCREQLFDFIVDKMKEGYRFDNQFHLNFFCTTIKHLGARVVHLEFTYHYDKDDNLIITCFYYRIRRQEKFLIQKLVMSKQFELPTFVEGEF